MDSGIPPPGPRISVMQTSMQENVMEKLLFSKFRSFLLGKAKCEDCPCIGLLLTVVRVRVYAELFLRDDGQHG